MSVNEIKDEVQRKGLNIWYQRGCKGTLEYATGVGKSRCGVLAAQFVAKSKPNAKILIITPTQTIRDEAWVQEFNNWEASKLLNVNVNIQCIQTVYKWKNQHYDLIIADEIHNYIPDVKKDDYQYYKFFENNTYDKILGLSASISNDLKPRLWKVAPIVDSIDTEYALQLGLISPFTVYNLKVDLTPEEKIAYDKATRVFEKTFSIFTDSRGRRNIQILFKCLNPHFFKQFCINEGYSPDQYREMQNWPRLCQDAMKARKEIIYNSENKIQAIADIVEDLQDRRGIVFSQSVDFANNVTRELGKETAVPFHSKMTKKVRKQNLDDFNDLNTSTRMIISASALNEGANLKDVSLAIIASGTSKEKDFIQRLGRSVRLKEGKQAIMIRLYVKDTQDEKWMQSSQENFFGIDIENVSQIHNLNYKKQDIKEDNIYKL